MGEVRQAVVVGSVLPVVGVILVDNGDGLHPDGEPPAVLQSALTRCSVLPSLADSLDLV